MNKRFLFFIAVFLVFVFVMQWKVPSQFVWNPTFSHGDSQSGLQGVCRHVLHGP